MLQKIRLLCLLKGFSSSWLLLFSFERSSQFSAVVTVDIERGDFVFSVMLLSTVEAAGSQITLEESGVLKTMEAMWTAISTTVTNFFTSVLTPVINFATTNPLTLIFLGIGFIGIGIRYMRRVTNAFGRGR